MCGIAGFSPRQFGASADQFISVRAMLNGLLHRGPDNSSIVTFPGGAILGSTRLGIADPSNQSANMPIKTSDDNSVLVLNGEIYNHMRLRQGVRNYDFKTLSDAESLSAYICSEHKDWINDLDGMFAIALYDANSETLKLYTDPSGQKPIYYFENSEGFFFCSEINALIRAFPNVFTVNVDTLATALLMRFCISNETHLKNVFKVRGGEELTFSNGTLRSELYYRLPEESKAVEEFSAANLGAILRRSCAETSQYVKKPGVFLSGGLDSSIVAIEATKVHSRILTYSIGFSDFSGNDFGLELPSNEFKYSRLVAKLIHSEHTEIELNERDYWRNFDSWISAQGEPVGVEEAPCLMALAKCASKDTRVILSGSGSDELFDGYQHSIRLKNELTENCLTQDLINRYLTRFLWLGDCDPCQLLGSEALPRVGHRIFEDVSLRMLKYSSVAYRTKLINFITRLPRYELHQLDHTSMASSVETRSPFLNRDVLDFGFKCPLEKHYFHNNSKWLLKIAFSDSVPDEIRLRKKEGFPVPIQVWFGAEYTERMQGVLSGTGRFAELGIMNLNYLRQLWQKETPNSRSIFFRILNAHALLESQRGFLK